MLVAARSTLKLFAAYLYDFRRYSSFSFVHKRHSRANRRAIIRIFAHYIEGGMCFPDIRLGYGQDKAVSIMRKIRDYVRDFEVDDSVQWAMASLRTYLEFHEDAGFALPDIKAEFDKLTAELGLTEPDRLGGFEPVTAVQIRERVAFDFGAFLRSRHSVRQYAKGRLDDRTIRDIVSDARQCPNVCNRQTCRVYALTKADDVQKALSFQAGNAGFRQEIQNLFIVTSDMGEMNLVGERFQGWIDGGIFAMTLALSIHARGLGACFLNWSVEPDTDKAMRRCLGIPDNELVITMMSAGHLKDEFPVPISRRKPVDEILTINPKLA